MREKHIKSYQHPKSKRYQRPSPTQIPTGHNRWLTRPPTAKQHQDQIIIPSPAHPACRSDPELGSGECLEFVPCPSFITTGDVGEGGFEGWDEGPERGEGVIHEESFGGCAEGVEGVEGVVAEISGQNQLVRLI